MFVRPALPTVALLAVVVLAGCTTSTSSSAGPSDPGRVAPSAGSSSTPPPLEDPTARFSEPVNTVTPQPDADLLVKVKWTRAEAVPGESAVLIYGTLTGGPPCAVIGRVDVTETAAMITITVHVGRQPGVNCSGAQAQLAFPYVTRVALKAPVGTRTVTDGA